jgi:hypothetical protein
LNINQNSGFVQVGRGDFYSLLQSLGYWRDTGKDHVFYGSQYSESGVMTRNSSKRGSSDKKGSPGTGV